jgi:hypothetical protein
VGRTRYSITAIIEAARKAAGKNWQVVNLLEGAESGG